MRVKIVGLDAFCMDIGDPSRSLAPRRSGRCNIKKKNEEFDDANGIKIRRSRYITSSRPFALSQPQNAIKVSAPTSLWWSGEPFWTCIPKECRRCKYPPQFLCRPVPVEKAEAPHTNMGVCGFSTFKKGAREEENDCVEESSNTDTHADSDPNVTLTNSKSHSSLSSSSDTQASDRSSSETSDSSTPRHYRRRTGRAWRGCQKEFSLWSHWLMSDAVSGASDTGRRSNILLYGLGSKSSFLDEMTDQCFRWEFPMVAVMCGLHPKLNLRRFFIDLLDEYQACSVPTVGATAPSYASNKVTLRRRKQLSDLKLELFRFLEGRRRRQGRRGCTRTAFGLSSPVLALRRPLLCLVVHNLDAPSLRGHQSFFADLAEHPLILLVASVDHLRYPCLWSGVEVAKFRFLHLHLSTFEDYRNEIRLRWSASGEPPWLSQTEVVQATPLDAARHALSAMPPKHKELYFEIAKAVWVNACKTGQRAVQGELVESVAPLNKDGCPWPSVNRLALFERSRQCLLYADLHKFNAALHEFEDHQLIKTTPGESSVQLHNQVLLVPLDLQTLLSLFPQLQEALTSSEDDDTDDDFGEDGDKDVGKALNDEKAKSMVNTGKDSRAPPSKRIPKTRSQAKVENK